MPLIFSCFSYGSGADSPKTLLPLAKTPFCLWFVELNQLMSRPRQYGVIRENEPLTKPGVGDFPARSMGWKLKATSEKPVLLSNHSSEYSTGMLLGIYFSCFARF